MILNLNERRHSRFTNTSEKYNFFDVMQKPIEIYFFLDPLCSKCWSLEPYLKKLSIEYGRFFTIRNVISSQLTIVSQQLDNPLENQTNDDLLNSAKSQLDKKACSLHPSITMAIKAAELQGKNAGRLFLRKIQEKFFLKKENVSDISILLSCANDANLDVEEFMNDLNSVSAKKASQCDLKITKEMKVSVTPTIVFFNPLIEEDGVKISGLNSYDIYVLILSEMLRRKPIPSKKPSLKDYLAHYKIVSHKELAIIYDMTFSEAEREMIKLQLKRIVKKKMVQNDIFWQYVQ